MSPSAIARCVPDADAASARHGEASRSRWSSRSRRRRYDFIGRLAASSGRRLGQQVLRWTTAAGANGRSGPVLMHPRPRVTAGYTIAAISDGRRDQTRALRRAVAYIRAAIRPGGDDDQVSVGADCTPSVPQPANVAELIGCEGQQRR